MTRTSTWAQAVEHRHQTVDRETRKFGVPDAGEICVVDAGPGLGLASRQTIVVQNLNDSRREQRLGLLDIGVRSPEISEDVTAAVDELKIVLFSHWIKSFFNRLSRSRIRSRSLFDVLMPCLAFF